MYNLMRREALLYILLKIPLISGLLKELDFHVPLLICFDIIHHIASGKFHCVFMKDQYR